MTLKKTLFSFIIIFFSGAEVVELVAEDSCGNVANVSLITSVTIQSSGTVPEGTVLPALENSPVQLTLNRGMARLPRLALCSRVGNYIGDYMLVFSAPDVEAYSVKFAFSTGKSITTYSSFFGGKKVFFVCTGIPPRIFKLLVAVRKIVGGFSQTVVEVDRRFGNHPV